MKCLAVRILIVIGIMITASRPRAELSDLMVDAKRLNKRIEKLAQFGINSQRGIDRVAFSRADILARKYIIDLMKQAGLQVNIDPAGNIIGLRKGSESKLPPIMVGSHLDTVPNGGKYDGALGVLAAVECAQIFYENHIRLRHPLEIVVFVDEEGGLIGSRAMTGRLTPQILMQPTLSGKTVQKGILAIKGDPEGIQKAARQKGEIRAFVELHVEQGRVLESKGVQIGIVEGIVGIRWWEIIVQGESNHAGTTPMHMRKDALLAAAKLIQAINKVVNSVSGKQVGTVGKIKVEPGAPNVIPGKVTMSLELRDLYAKKMDMLFKEIYKQAQDIAKKTQTRIDFVPSDVNAAPAVTDPILKKQVQAAVQLLGLTSHCMPSGAGHDTQEIARIAPTAMIFIPSKAGISHNPAEYSTPIDVANGTNVLLHTILGTDATPSD